MAENEKLKIAMVAPADNPHTVKFARHFLSKDWDLKVVSYSVAEIENVDIYVHSRIDPKSRGMKRKILYLQDYLEIRKILSWADIIFVNYIYNWRFNKVYRGFKNVVVWVWGSDITNQQNETEKEAYYKRMILKIASRVIATSSYLAAETKKYLPENVEAEIIPMGVDVNKFHPEHKAWNPDIPVIIGYAKGLYEKYGCHVLLEALQILDMQQFDFKALIAGGGELEVPLKLYADKLGIKERVEFVGRLDPDDVPDFMRQLDIFVMPSVVKESFGVAALEASASGIPVVASDIGGIPEVVWADETGILFPPGDAQSLADALSTLIQNKDLRDCMGAQGRDYVKKNFSWQVTVDGLDRIFREVLNHKK